MQFFKSSNTPSKVDISQSIIDFMNENAKADTAPVPQNDPHKEIQSKLKK